MSKRSLKKYLETLNEEQLREQIMELYSTFKDVKVYYDFVFNPKEDKLVREAKEKIANEYFPVKRRKPRARRSVAQKYIKHFLTLGVSPVQVADVMWYNLEIATTFNAEKQVKQEAFYKSMAGSFDEALKYTLVHGLPDQFEARIHKLYDDIKAQDWSSLYTVEQSMQLLE